MKSRLLLNFFSLHRNYTMSILPPRKVSVAGKTFKRDANPLEILLQMGFPKNRALKALAATGNRSVQLASDWLLTHVNDSTLDVEAPREYTLYACPTGLLLEQLHGFWKKSKELTGWNGAHNLPPHITLVPFFKAPDENSLQLEKSVKQVVESVGGAPESPLKLEPYMSPNFMGLFVSEEHAEYLKSIADQYVKQITFTTINLEPHLKSLHITLAYHFPVPAYDQLKQLVDDMQPISNSDWELRLYSRDPRFDTHQVYKVNQSYTPKEDDELELVLGDYIYVAEKAVDTSPDGWVQGTSWLTGVTGYLPALYTQRTAESDAWTIHKAMSLNHSNGTDVKSDTDSATDSENVVAPSVHCSPGMAVEKSEECYQEWEKYWKDFMTDKREDVLTTAAQNGATAGKSENHVNGKADVVKREIAHTNGDSGKGRWLFAMRHGERVDLTYGSWVPSCFDEHDKYVRQDLNMPLKLAERSGGKDAYVMDTPLTRVGWLQAYLVGEGLRLAGVGVSRVYASLALRSVETAQAFLEGLQSDPSVKIRVEPGLFEYKYWYSLGLSKFMTPLELQKAGYNVDINYKPYIEELGTNTDETVAQFYGRVEKVIHGAYKDTEAEGGNIMFVGHSSTLDMLWYAMRRHEASVDLPPYTIGKHLVRVPYCAVAAVRDKPVRLVPPPCPPAINTSSGRFDWRILHQMQ